MIQNKQLKMSEDKDDNDGKDDKNGKDDMKNKNNYKHSQMLEIIRTLPDCEVWQNIRQSKYYLLAFISLGRNVLFTGRNINNGLGNVQMHAERSVLASLANYCGFKNLNKACRLKR